MTQKGVQLLSERDIRLLRLVCEQYLVSIPQLAYVSGRSERTARWLRTRWERAGLARGGQLLVGDSTFVWATGQGLSLCGYRWKPVTPRLWGVNALAAVELRLAVEEQYPGASIETRRMLSHGPTADKSPPDLLIRVGGRSVGVYVQQRDFPYYDQLSDWLGVRAHGYAHTIYAVHPRQAPKLEALLDSQGVGYRTSVLAYRRDPRCCRPPLLPAVESLYDPEQARREREQQQNSTAAPTPETVGSSPAHTAARTQPEPAVRIRPAQHRPAQQRQQRRRGWR
jgi:hypothetical protein